MLRGVLEVEHLSYVAVVVLVGCLLLLRTTLWLKTHMILEFKKRGIRAQGFRHELAGTPQPQSRPEQTGAQR